MTAGPQAALLSGGRLHLQHGPIDLVIEAFGDKAEKWAAYRQAWLRFETILEPLVEELEDLRRPVGEAPPAFRGPVARRMAAGVWPHRAVFITPMAAVAGAVADEVLAAMVAGRRLARAYVNNGGDIALHLSPGERFDAGVVAEVETPRLDAVASVSAEQPVRGIATSGWRGRSLSFGIADSVTVLADCAAAADAAATLIANTVAVDHPAIERRPADSLRDDTDLGDRPVTVAVGPLPEDSVEEALTAGAGVAAAMRERGLIATALIVLRNRTRVVGADRAPDKAQQLGSRQWN